MVDVALDEIRTAILSGALPPGTRIRQEELAERLAVSRAPIRQALVILERSGLVRTDRLRGTVVTRLEPTLIRDLYEFRGAIEWWVAMTLAARTDFDSARAREIVVAGREAVVAGDFPRLIDLDLRFHTGLYNAVGNEVLSEVMHGQWTHIRRVMAATLTISGYPQHVWEEHAAIVDAIDAHDAGLAGALAAAHTRAASARLMERWAAEPEAPPADTNASQGRRKRRRRSGSGSRSRADRPETALDRPAESS
jgi:DNA-binding GntR family transcriptional regulator